MSVPDPVVTFTTFIDLVKLNLMILAKAFNTRARRQILSSVMLNALRLHEYMDHIPEDEEDLAADEFIEWCLSGAAKAGMARSPEHPDGAPEQPIWVPEEFTPKFN